MTMTPYEALELLTASAENLAAAGHWSVTEKHLEALAVLRSEIEWHEYPREKPETIDGYALVIAWGPYLGSFPARYHEDDRLTSPWYNLDDDDGAENVTHFKQFPMFDPPVRK